MYFVGYLPFPTDVLMTGLLVHDSEPSAPNTCSAAYNVRAGLVHFFY